ncbi:MAG: hypothetical protein HY718_08700 [Planctomycetes bacterium]|nr:hypothetical protein [Planctomycetota bacterium]
MATHPPTHWLTEAGMFFEKSGPLWETLRNLEARLQDAQIPYVIIGGLALNAYNYPRQTQDADVVVRDADFQRFKDRFGREYEPRKGAPRRFADMRTEAWVDFLIAGEIAGNRRKNRVVRFPDPSEGEIRNDLRTVSLPRLIELKLVTWRYKDWGDVVELIRRNQLPESVADQMDASVRSAYLQCYDQANEETYDAG